MIQQRLDPRRREILGLMGIDIWTLRTPRSENAAPKTDATLDGGVDRRLPAARRASPAELGAAADPVQEQESPLSLVCLEADRAMLLLESGPHLSARFWRDVLAAACGRWDVQPQVVSFVWPDPEFTHVGGSSEGWRAFKAFMERRLSESPPSVLLCGVGLSGRLPALPDGCRLVMLPDTADPGVEAKRALWRELGVARA